MISIKLNGEQQEVKENISLNELLILAKFPIKGIAIAVNQTIVPKQNWANTNLANNDELLIIKATQGG